MSVSLKKGEKNLTKSKMNAACGAVKMDHFRKVFQNEMEMQRHSIKNISSAKERRKQKRFRSAFTTTQVAIMEQEFRKNPYVTNVHREQMANTLHLPERAIKIWFQNRRMKEKRDPSKSAELEVISQNSFDNNLIRTTKSPSPSKGTVYKSENQLNETDSENDVKLNVNNNVTKQQNLLPETKIFISNGQLTISKIATEKTYADNMPNVAFNYSSGGSVREVEIKPVKLVNKAFMPVERSIQKQPVGHILPFSQVIASEPQKSPENLTLYTNKEPAPLPNEPKEPETSQYPGYYPLDLTKYYTPVPPLNAWNRLGFIPLMSDAQGFQYNSNTTITPESPPSYTPKKCCCDCHSSVNSTESPRLQPTYPVVYTQYIPHIMAQLPPQYHLGNDKY